MATGDIQLDILQRSSSESAILDVPDFVQYRSQSHRQQPQSVRNTVAVVNSEYYTSRRPQLVQLHSALRPTPSAPILDTISENEASERFRQQDLRLFRYTPTPILDPARQRVPTPLSRPTTPQSMTGPPASLRGSNSSLHPGAIPYTFAEENQFLPLYINPQSGHVYMFEDGYYIPLSPELLQTFNNSLKVAVTQPPAPDRRTGVMGSREDTLRPPPDYTIFVQLLTVLFFICCDIPVIVICSLPALFYAHKARKAIREGRYRAAQRHSEYVLCFNIIGTLSHVVLLLGVVALFLALNFATDTFDNRLQ